MGNIKQRLRKLRADLRRRKLDALVVTGVHNVRYLSGFTGEDSALLVERKDCLLVTDSRYTEAAEKELAPNGIGVVQRRKSMVETIALLGRKRGWKAMGFEGAAVSFDLYTRLSGQMKGVELKATEQLVERLREIKDAAEIQTIRRAVKVAEDALRATIPSIRPGVGEMDVAVELDHQMRRLGAQESAFPTIVAGGERASLPHARPTKRKIRGGEAVLIDWGARLEFYNSDLTRVLFLGTMPPVWQKRYDAVLQAQQAALRGIRPNVTASAVDRVARNWFKRRRLGRRFGHGVGHGVGLEVHEAPRVGRESETRLKPGMIFTVEPGIYFPNWGGVRIEDMVLVTKTGKEVLTCFGKNPDLVVI